MSSHHVAGSRSCPNFFRNDNTLGARIYTALLLDLIHLPLLGSRGLPRLVLLVIPTPGPSIGVNPPPISIVCFHLAIPRTRVRESGTQKHHTQRKRRPRDPPHHQPPRYILHSTMYLLHRGLSGGPSRDRQCLVQRGSVPEKEGGRELGFDGRPAAAVSRVACLPAWDGGGVRSGAARQTGEEQGHSCFLGRLKDRVQTVVCRGLHSPKEPLLQSTNTLVCNELRMSEANFFSYIKYF